MTSLIFIADMIADYTNLIQMSNDHHHHHHRQFLRPAIYLSEARHQLRFCAQCY